MRRFVPRGKRPHRCMHRLEEWIEQRHRGAFGPRRRKRCMTRKSFDPYQDPPKCPGCGSREHWRDEKPHRKKDRARETCRSGSCPLTFPHSVHSAECVNNPHGYYDDLMGEWRVRCATSGDVPF